MSSILKRPSTISGLEVHFSEILSYNIVFTLVSPFISDTSFWNFSKIFHLTLYKSVIQLFWTFLKQQIIILYVICPDYYSYEIKASLTVKLFFIYPPFSLSLSLLFCVPLVFFRRFLVPSSEVFQVRYKTDWNGFNL